MRYFLTARTANGTGRYITGQLIADPDIEEAGANLRRPALWNLWVDDDIPTDDVVVRYRLYECRRLGPVNRRGCPKTTGSTEAGRLAEMSELVRERSSWARGGTGR